MSLVRTEVSGGVAVVTLDDPERRNALTLDMVDVLAVTFDDLEASAEVGAVIVTGAPPAFCAGADLSDLGSAGDSAGGPGGGGRGLRAIYDGFLRIGRSSLPTIAAVNGPAVGAGMNVALVCDVRLAARSARFDTRFLQLGLHPGGGHTWMMRQLVGPQAAAAMVLFGEVLDADEAERQGLVWRVVDDEALLPTARELASRAARAPREVVRRVKSTLAAMSSVGFQDDAVRIELDAQLWSMRQPEFRDRLAKLQRRISSQPGG